MDRFTITLENHCYFAIPAAGKGGFNRRVSYDRENPNSPWTVLGQEPSSGHWYSFECFETLDQALDHAVGENLEEEKPSYSVILPCGSQFSRPGKVRAEEVLTALGWCFVSTISGYATYSPEANVSLLSAESHFQKLLPASTTANLGEVSNHSDDQGHLWIAEYHMPFDSFIMFADIEDQKKLCFAAEGIELIDGYNYTTPFDAKANTGKLVSMNAFMLSKETKAA